jgi:RNA polymerase sigma-70 factor (sigma-E family)
MQRSAGDVASEEQETTRGRERVDRTVEEEFTDFVVRRSHALLRVAHTLTGDAHAAEDLVQQALAKAFVHWRRITGDAEPYVKRIIYHDSASRWRRRSTHAETMVAAPPDHAYVPDRTHDTHLRLMLRDAMLMLPPRQRAVLALRYLEDLTVEETAEILGCRPGTVASQASKGLAKLRDLVPDGLASAAEPVRPDRAGGDDARVRDDPAAATLARAAISEGVRKRRRRTAVVAGSVALVTTLALLIPYAVRLGAGPTPVGGSPGPTVSTSPSGPVPSEEVVPTHTVTTGTGPIPLIDGWVVLGNRMVLDVSRGAYVRIPGDDLLPAPTGEWVAASVSDPFLPTYEVTHLPTGETRLHTVTSSIMQPQWSPDGTRLLFTVMPKGGGTALEVHILEAATGTFTVIPVTTHDSCVRCAFTWLPNGREVALALARNAGEAGPEQPTGIQVLDLDGRPVRQLPLPGRPGGPGSWSPDGQRVVLTGVAEVDGTRTEQAQIVEVNTGKIIATLGNPLSQVSWIDNGRMLVSEPAVVPGGHAARVTLRTGDGTALERWIIPGDISYGPRGWPDVALVARLG